jgi:hypothetical protein
MTGPTAALLAVALAGSAVAQTAIQPGYWESTNRLLSPIPSTSREMRCIQPADVEKFMAGPSNRHYACTYPTRIIAHGRIILKGTCVSKKGRQVSISGKGSYTFTSFHLEADIATEFAGLPITGRASTDAHRVADACPPPAPSPDSAADTTQAAPAPPAN